jgi:endonuclease YncB( thermonuclease family)
MEIAMNAIRLFVLAICLAGPLAGAHAKSGEFTGIPKIVDGDTIQFGDIRLKMEGIDAPQMDQLCLDKAGVRWKCGVAAREYLRSKTGSKPWSCEVVRQNHHGRLLARCLAGSDDIARVMVRSGWALASTTGSARYLPSEQEARLSEAGLWAGAFVAPLDWRQHNRHAKIFGRGTVPEESSDQLLTSAFGASPPSTDCAIKGNVNWSGKCVFHKPGGRWYKRITMEAKYGDRWFCTPIEAISSGCRETRR